MPKRRFKRGKMGISGSHVCASRGVGLPGLEIALAGRRDDQISKCNLQDMIFDITCRPVSRNDAPNGAKWPPEPSLLCASRGVGLAGLKIALAGQRDDQIGMCNHRDVISDITCSPAAAAAASRVRQPRFELPRDFFLASRLANLILSGTNLIHILHVSGGYLGSDSLYFACASTR